MAERFKDISCEQYLEELASKAPVPGGGGTAALCGALGCALGTMVGSLTVGKKAYAENEPEILRLMERTEEARRALTLLIDRDPEVFEPLSRAYKMPSATEEEKREKDETLQRCIEDAMQVPMDIFDCCGKIMDCFAVYAEKGSSLAVSDAACGAALCRAAMESAALNIYVNTRFLKDAQRAERINASYSERLEAAKAEADRVILKVSRELTHS